MKHFSSFWMNYECDQRKPVALKGFFAPLVIVTTWEGRSGLTSKRWELPAFNHETICANWRFRSKTKNYLLHNRHQQNPIIRFRVKRWRNLPFCFTLNPLEGSSSTTCMLGAATRTQCTREVFANWISALGMEPKRFMRNSICTSWLC